MRFCQISALTAEIFNARYDPGFPAFYEEGQNPCWRPLLDRFQLTDWRHRLPFDVILLKPLITSRLSALAADAACAV